MPKLSQEQIDQAREVDLLAYLLSHESGVLKQEGANYRHNEHDSLVYVASKNYWYWNSRGRKINAVDYLMEIRGYSFVEAVERLTGCGTPTVSHYTASGSREQRKPVKKKPFRLPRGKRCATFAVSYCETFTSTEDGIILIEGLRVGKYTVTEVKNKASEDYIIPDGATVEIKADETAEVSFFNEKPEEETPETPDKPETPDNPTTPSNPSKPVPQTGDDYNLYIWIGVLGAAVIGSGVALFLCAYKKKGQKFSTGRRRAATGVLLICIAMAVGSGFMLAREIGQYKESADTYAGLSEYVTPAETDGENGTVEAPEETGASSISLPTVDFESLLAQGPDVKAWLELPGTVIQYPVAQGEDNSYYLKHLYDGTANKVGCLFIDYENAEDFSDNNTIIYGHNMRDGSMFSTLVEYKAQAYYDEHPEMYLVTPEGGYVVEVFSAFVASPEESGSETSPWALEWKDSGAYTTWLSAMQERSVIETGVSVTSSDKVLTLSTCTNGGADRFIVMGRLVAVTE